MKFGYVTVVGIEDFNFPEVKELDDVLRKAQVEHEVIVFSGVHEWPPAEVLIGAVEWFELRAVRTGARVGDNDFVERLWRKQLTRARELQSANRMYEALQAYTAAAKAFKSLRDVTEAENQAAMLADLREVKTAQRNEANEFKKQRQLQSQIYRLAAAQAGLKSLFTDEGPKVGTVSVERGDSLPPAGRTPETTSSDFEPPTTGNLKTTLSELRKTSNSNEDSSDRRVARRVLSGLYIGFYEQGRSLLETQKRYAEAARLFGLATQVSPERPGAF